VIIYYDHYVLPLEMPIMVRNPTIISTIGGGVLVAQGGWRALPPVASFP
jgi:hypothetical protein